MKETLIEHLNDEDVMLSSRDAPVAVEVLEKVPVRHAIMWPVVETWITGNTQGYLGDPQPSPQLRVWHKMPWGCWHDLGSATEQELAGMGLCIIGNLCKGLASKQISSHADARLELRQASLAAPIPLPWPGLPDARPLPLDLCQLPFEVEMFLNDEGHFTKRVDRLALMRRIETTWVPYLVGASKRW